MTNQQAGTVAINCQVALGSKQLLFGVKRRLEKNTKIGHNLSKEEQEIILSAQTNKASDEELAKELEEFRSKEFTGEFEKIRGELLENVGHEMIEVIYGTGEARKEIKYDIQKILSFLEESGLIE